jgi:hypothetical protein
MNRAWTAAPRTLPVFGAFDAGHGSGDKQKPEHSARDLKDQHRQYPYPKAGRAGVAYQALSALIVPYGTDKPHSKGKKGRFAATLG